MKVSLKKRNDHIALLLLIGSLGAPLRAADWTYETVPGPGGGKYSSMRVDANGNAHVCYYDDAAYQLRYGFWDHKLDKWFTTTLDGSSGFCSLALDSKQQPRVSYDDYGTGKLKYAYWNGTEWRKEAIQIRAKDISYYTSLTLDSADNPSISYYEYWGTGDNYELHLRAVTWNGSYWGVRTVDSTPGSGKFNSMALDSSGRPHVAYAAVTSENASLRYATWTGQAWNVEVLEGGGPTHFPVFSVALVIHPPDTPHIAYTDVNNHLIKYATKKGSKWITEVVDSVTREAYPDKNGIALDSDGNPFITYYDLGAGQLKLAHKENGKWLTELIDQNAAGLNSSVQISQGMIWVTYADETGHGLKFARRPLPGMPRGESSRSSAQVHK